MAESYGLCQVRYVCGLLRSITGNACYIICAQTLSAAQSASAVSDMHAVYYAEIVGAGLGGLIGRSSMTFFSKMFFLHAIALCDCGWERNMAPTPHLLFTK